MKKLLTLTRIPSELYEDEAIGIGQWFTEEIGWAFATKEDQCGFIGDGSSTYAGIRGACVLLNDADHAAGRQAAAAGHSSPDKLDGTDLANLMGLLPARAWPNARWFVSGSVVGLCFAKIAPAALQRLDDGSLVFMGFPISMVPSMPSGTSSAAGKIVALFGDMRTATILASRREVRVRLSQQRYLDQDQLGLQGTERFDVVVQDASTATAAGAIVGLQATA
jgi:HK97 family phage major capsid protein